MEEVKSSVNVEELKTPFNKAQLELLKLFSRVNDEEELMEIKRLISRYYAEKAMDKIDKLWEERGYTQEDMDRIANSPS